VEAFGYWLLTDFIEERLPYDDLTYFGVCGLFTYCGIPKAGWTAMLLLRKLGVGFNSNLTPMYRLM